MQPGLGRILDHIPMAANLSQLYFFFLQQHFVQSLTIYPNIILILSSLTQRYHSHIFTLNVQTICCIEQRQFRWAWGGKPLLMRVYSVGLAGKTFFTLIFCLKRSILIWLICLHDMNLTTISKSQTIILHQMLNFIFNPYVAHGVNL